MAFERTAQGQANRALFLGADLVCYVEGDGDREDGVDVLFWISVFEALAPEKTVHVSPRGGKAILEALAREVVQGDIRNTLVAMDRDFSEFRPGRYIDDPRAFYTYGYSWENDVYYVSQIVRISARLARVAALPANEQTELEQDAKRLDQSSGKFVFADFCALLRGGSVFDRSRPGRYSTVQGDGRPTLALDRCSQDFKKAKAELADREVRPAVGYPREGSRYLWGKAFEHYVRMGVIKTVRAVSGQSVGNDHLRDVAISCFAHCLASGQNSPVLDHYRAMRFRLGV